MRKLIFIVVAVFMVASVKAADIPKCDSLPGKNILDMVKTMEVTPVDMTKNQPKFNKIVGGVVAKEGEFPFIVSLQHALYGHFCGGSLVSKNWVLTAAHCVTGITPKSVMIGLHNQDDIGNAEDIKQVKIIKHPKWDDDTMDYDFALIKLEEDSSYPSIDFNTVPVEGEINFITAGWGTLSENGSASDTLMKVEVPFVNQEKCSEAYPGWVTDSMLCAGFDEGGKDACQGDSGGPLIIRENGSTVLAGVVSWGNGCARPNQPGVYSKVSGVIDWLQETIAE